MTFSIGVPYLCVIEVPNPLGVIAVLSAFNFPVAVYGWYDGLFDYLFHAPLIQFHLGIWHFPWLRAMRQSGSHLRQHLYVLLR